MPGTARSTAPLKPAQDALLLDNSDMTVQASVDTVLDWWQGQAAVPWRIGA
jgi:3-phosphoshikimate 1-carboxyvinyltransferase